VSPVASRSTDLTSTFEIVGVCLVGTMLHSLPTVVCVCVCALDHSFVISNTVVLLVPHHTHCFTCATCQAPLENYYDVGGVAYCEAHNPQLLSSERRICAACGDRITGYVRSAFIARCLSGVGSGPMPCENDVVVAVVVVVGLQCVIALRSASVLCPSLVGRRLGIWPLLLLLLLPIPVCAPLVEGSLPHLRRFPLGSACMNVLGKYWHNHCLRCCQCGVVLGQEIFVIGQQTYCAPCSR
jgi:LIM domain